jgi:hypothetical protein
MASHPDTVPEECDIAADLAWDDHRREIEERMMMEDDEAAAAKAGTS